MEEVIIHARARTLMNREAIRAPKRPKPRKTQNVESEEEEEFRPK